MNLNEVAKRVTQLEGKKVQVNIAQVKEVLKCLMQLFDDLPYCRKAKAVKRKARKAPKRKVTRGLEE